MAQYRYLFRDLRTNTALAELPLTDVSYSGALNDIGTFSATLAIADPRVRSLEALDATVPSRTALFVDRDGVLVWGGIVWTRTYSSQRRTLALAGAEFLSYFGSRYNTGDKVYSGVTRLEAARRLIDDIQLVFGANIGVAVGGTDSDGVLADWTFPAVAALNVLDTVEDLAGVRNGFDFSVELRYTAGAPVKTFTPRYPRKGRAWYDSGHVWEYGPTTRGNVIAYEWPEDGHRTATTVLGFGAGEGATMVRVIIGDSTLIFAGYPRLDRVFTNKQIKDLAELDRATRAVLAAYARPVVLPKLTVLADADPALGTWTLGDDCRIRITDEDRFPRQDDGSPGLDVYRRVVGYRVKVADDGGPELVDLTIGETLA